MLLTTHKADFGHHYASYLAAVGFEDHISLPWLFLDVMASTAATTHTRSSLPYSALVTRLCYEENVQSRANDTYLVIEVPLGAAFLAKLASALGAAAAKRRRAAADEGTAAVGGSSETAEAAETEGLPTGDPSDDPTLDAPGDRKSTRLNSSH